VQNCEINLDFDLFLKKKGGRPSPWVVDCTIVAAPGHDDLPQRHGRQKGGDLPHRPKEAAVQHPEEGETSGGSVLGRKAAVAWADFGKFERKSRRAAKATRPN
jgi:hypothetical protein